MNEMTKTKWLNFFMGVAFVFFVAMLMLMAYLNEW